jgi:hypothetical protein
VVMNGEGDDPNGYQLEREGALWANASMSF